MPTPPVSLGPCPLCGRPMIAGPSVDQHHFVPKSRGGRVKTPLHRICHRKLHSLFTEKELAGPYATPEALLAHPDIQTFVTWVARRPPEFYDRTATAKSKRR